MGLFDTIRGAVGGSGPSDDAREESSDLLDSTALGPDDFDEYAEYVAEQNSLDFSLRSLDRLDSLVAAADRETAGDGVAEKTYTETTIRLGSYLGTVLVDAYDGQWVREDRWAVSVSGGGDDVTVNVFEVAVKSIDDRPVFAAVAERLEARLLGATESGADTDSESSADDQTTAAVAEPDAEEPNADHRAAEEPDTNDRDAGQPDADHRDGQSDTEPDVEPSDTEPTVEVPEATDEPADSEDTRESPDDAPDDSELLSETPTDEPEEYDGLRAEYAETAVDFAEFWSERELDFTPASLGRLDDLVDGQWDSNRFRDATFGSEDSFDDRAFTSLVLELGSYFGEVLVRELDGEWADETDHEAAVVVDGTAGSLAVPVFEIAETSLRKRAVFEQSYDALLSDLDRSDSSGD